MYEGYYGFTEKPFSLTPDPKFLFRSRSHGDAFDLLQYAITRREGFAVITGDIGTGKTTLCRALLEQIDRRTFTALLLNPFVSEEDLLKRILQDFGVISRDEAKAGRLASVSKQDLIDTLYDFLLGLIPLKANAVLIIDEAQHVPLPVLEQIRILSNLETDKEKLLQIVFVGQLELQALLRSHELRQLDQRVSIRYELKPLDREAVGAYVSHRIAIAGGASAVTFTPDALDKVHSHSGGIPRLVNLICDRALLSGYSLRTNRITPEIIDHAAKTLDVAPLVPSRPSSLRRASMAAVIGVVTASAAFGAGLTGYIYQRVTAKVEATTAPAATPPPFTIVQDRELPADAAATILVASYPAASPKSPDDVHALTAWLETEGLRVYYATVDRGKDGRWQRVLVGAYKDEHAAQDDFELLKSAAPSLNARIVTTKMATTWTPGPPASPEPQ